MSRQQRANGTGSAFYVRARRRWYAEVSLPGGRRTKRACPDREAALALLARPVEEWPPPKNGRPLSKQSLMVQVLVALGRFWRAKRATFLLQDGDGSKRAEYAAQRVGAVELLLGRRV